jgi:hypothetical protein
MVLESRINRSSKKCKEASPICGEIFLGGRDILMDVLKKRAGIAKIRGTKGRLIGSLKDRYQLIYQEAKCWRYRWILAVGLVE